MTKIQFGHSHEDANLRTIAERLDNYTSFNVDMTPELFEEMPREFKDALSASVHLKVQGLVSSSREVSFQVEWDSVEAYTFRGSELWMAETQKALVRVRPSERSNWFFLEGTGNCWAAIRRIGSRLYGSKRGISQVTIPGSVLKTILERDSRGEVYMWWKDVEAGGIDGALSGPLRRGRGLRATFDQTGDPCFARFDSRRLDTQVSISCKQGSVGGRQVSANEAINYFKAVILPELPSDQ